MSELGTAGRPLRVAVIGSGPAAFYVVEHLFKHKDLQVAVDMFERLPTPFGLVRFGVAPDHGKIKSVISRYEKQASSPMFRFLGNVDVGAHVTVADLGRFYDQLCFATGAQSDRQLGIPGEDLEGSHAATEFVAWYNGHPDYRDRTFDLSGAGVAVIGVGNVAVDVARVLCRTHEELAVTDIADHALAALRASRITDVHMIGRRGPAQAAFTNVEVRELGDLEAAEIVVRPDEVELDELSRREVEHAEDRALLKRLEILNEFATRTPVGKPQRLAIRFMLSPVEILGEHGRVTGIRLVRNRLEQREDGRLAAVPTGEYEELAVSLVFRSVGYRGVPIAGLPFDERGAVVPNEGGRVTGKDGTQVGMYVAGWIKRGPTGVIGTNKPDAGETVEAMLEDAKAGRTLQPTDPTPAAAEAFVRTRQPDVFTYQDWQQLDALEVARGAPLGRPRVKFTNVEDMLDAVRATKRQASS